MEPSILDPRLAERLREIYRLSRTPQTLDEFGQSLFLQTTTNPRLRDFFQQIKAGKTAIGECSEKHGYSLTMADGRRVEVMCAYDALMSSILQGKGDVHAVCPHCGDRMEVRIEGMRLSESSPRSIVFWLGAGPRDAPGNPVCDHLHMFPDDKHLHAWVGSRSGELGVSMSLEEAVQFLVRSESTPPA